MGGSTGLMLLLFSTTSTTDLIFLDNELTSKNNCLSCSYCAEVLRQEKNAGEDASHVMDVGFVYEEEEAQAIKEAEEEQHIAPRRSRRNTRNANPKYVLLYILLIHAIFVNKLCDL